MSRVLQGKKYNKSEPLHLTLGLGGFLLHVVSHVLDDVYIYL
jgi:hypothetical protein